MLPLKAALCSPLYSPLPRCVMLLRLLPRLRRCAMTQMGAHLPSPLCSALPPAQDALHSLLSFSTASRRNGRASRPRNTHGSNEYRRDRHRSRVIAQHNASIQQQTDSVTPGLLPILSARPPSPAASVPSSSPPSSSSLPPLRPTVCLGCGAVFQTEHEHEAGFIHQSSIDKFMAQLQRRLAPHLHTATEEAGADAEAEVEEEAAAETEEDAGEPGQNAREHRAAAESESAADREALSSVRGEAEAAAAGWQTALRYGELTAEELRLRYSISVLTPKQARIETERLRLEADARWAARKAAAPYDRPRSASSPLPPAPAPLRCVRCWQLRHYGHTRGAIASVIASDLRHLLTGRLLSPSSPSSVVLLVVDLTELHCSIIPSLSSLVGGRNPIIVVGNKVDLLQLRGGVGAVRLRGWLKAELRRYGISFHSVQLVSAKTGEGVAGLMRAATQLAAREEGKQSRDLYLVGAVNTGKSSLLNRLIDLQFVRRKGELVEGEQTAAAAAQPVSASSPPLTSSRLPGTTLGLVGFPLVPAREGSIFDTPGVVSHPLPPSLLQAELRALLPSRPISPVTYRLKEGQCLLLGGLARIDLVTGRPFFFTVYASAAVSHHVSNTQRMDGEDGAETMLRLVEQGRLSPPFTAERFQQLGLSRAERLLFELQGRGWMEAGADIVFPGVGWVAVTGAGQLTVRASIAGTETVEGEEELRRLPFAREPLMPYDARTSTTSFFGADRRINRYRPPTAAATVAATVASRAAAVKQHSPVQAVAARSSRVAAFSSRSLASRSFSSASTARSSAAQPGSAASSASAPAVVSSPSSISPSVAPRGRPQWSVYKQLLQQHAALVQSQYRRTEQYLRRPKGSWRQQPDGAWLKLFRKKDRFTRPGAARRRMQQRRDARQQQQQLQQQQETAVTQQ